jgi:glutamine synthetase
MSCFGTVNNITNMLGGAGGGEEPSEVLSRMSMNVWTLEKMHETVPGDVMDRFILALRSGAPTAKPDRRAIELGFQKWAVGLGARNFAHWFFPMRFGGGDTGSSAGMKHDTFVDLAWEVDSPRRPFKSVIRSGGLFAGETDGSSFPNGGVRQTATAAAFTSWDRSSPPVIFRGTAYVPCAFVTKFGLCLDDKTPLLRSSDAINREGIRLCKNLGLGQKREVVNYLGWEQEFFLVSKSGYLKRPDLIACGRTLFGCLPHRGQQADLNYFSPVVSSVKEFFNKVQEASLECGISLMVHHNEVAPGQHEVAPVFSVSNIASDGNQLFMDMAQKTASELDLMVLFHEKPFAGINGTGKHANWSVGTAEGENFFDPGSSDQDSRLFVTAVACLTHALNQHNEVLRGSVAHAGNDHRLGAQEAPPAIISLGPGIRIEEYMDAVIEGKATLEGFRSKPMVVDALCSALNPIPTGLEDRNRTAPFPFCGNRFEFRACGSGQNTSFPVAMLNSSFADGMKVLNDKIEGGMKPLTAVAEMFKTNRRIVFNGDGYSAAWPIEAKKRGIPNLNNAVLAAEAFSSVKSKKLFSDMKVFTEEEVDARQEVMYEAYSVIHAIEVDTMIDMVETMFLPACAKDLATYKGTELGGSRKDVYGAVKAAVEDLKACAAKAPTAEPAAAKYYCNTAKAKMVACRTAVDAAERLCESSIWPVPTYEELIFHHHF